MAAEFSTTPRLVPLFPTADMAKTTATDARYFNEISQFCGNSNAGSNVCLGGRTGGFGMLPKPLIEFTKSHSTGLVKADQK
jgi:hypothetical protein